MHNLMTRLITDHQRLDQVLTLLEAELERLEAGDDVDYQLVSDTLRYLAQYADQVHHPLEDAVFEQVLKQAAVTEEQQDRIHLNHTQHTQLIGATGPLADDVEQILNDCVVPMDRLLSHMRHYLTLQRNHMDTENKLLFPLAIDLLNEQDWQTVQAQWRDISDPLFEEQQRIYRDLSERLNQAA